MQASRCSMQDGMPRQVVPVQRRLLRPNSFCTPGLSLLSRNVAVASRDRHRCLPRASSEQLGIGRVSDVLAFGLLSRRAGSGVQDHPTEWHVCHPCCLAAVVVQAPSLGQHPS